MTKLQAVKQDLEEKRYLLDKIAQNLKISWWDGATPDVLPKIEEMVKLLEMANKIIDAVDCAPEEDALCEISVDIPSMGHRSSWLKDAANTWMAHYRNMQTKYD